jgi:DNA primase
MAKEFFLAVKDYVDIVDVISHYVSLTKMGNYYKGLSPFKSEKTASFTVTPEKKIFYCFSTHIGGDAIDFISRIEHCSQYEAACILIERYSLPINKTSYKISKEEEKKENQYFKIHDLFVKYCQKKLLENEAALSYIKKRNITKESLIKFHIGYCPYESFAVKEFIEITQKEGILKEEIKKAHIIQENKTKKALFIPEKRILFPIMNQLNLPCGYGGRIYTEGDDRAKYINSMASTEFNKKSLLYNFYEAKTAMRKTKEVFFVEGFLDVILMDQAGYHNTVATMGTAPTEHHIELIKKFTEKIIIMYDGDAAGRNAILKCIHLCWNQEIDLEVVILPEGEDPASLVSKKQIEDTIKKKISAIDFFIGEKKEHFKKKSLKEMSSALKECIDILKAIEDQKKREIIKIKMATALGIETTTINQIIKKENQSTNNQEEEKKEQSTEKKEKQLDRYLFFHLTLFFYDPADSDIKKGITIIRYMFEEIPKKILEDFIHRSKKERTDYLVFLKEHHEKAYHHAVKILNTYSFDKKQYSLILQRMIKETWLSYAKKEHTFTQFLLFLESE